MAVDRLAVPKEFKRRNFGVRLMPHCAKCADNNEPCALMRVVCGISGRQRAPSA